MQPGSPVDRPARGGVPDGPAAPSAPEPRTPGSDAPESGADSVVIGGRYRLLTRSGPDEDTGAGRLSTWRARDNLLQRDVLLRIHAPGGPAARGLLDRALAAGVLSHPALAMVYDAVDEDRRAYVVSEWVDGQSLAQALTGGPLPEAYARETIRRVAEGVAQAHQVGLAVGGLVPERIILTRSGSVTVAAIPAPAADFAGDLRALGELLFATMAGFLPLTDDPVELDQQLTNASAPDLADAALAALDGRLQSAAELVAELVAHRRPGSLGESGGLSFITDRYEYDGPVTDVWPTISGPRDAASQDGPDAEAPREGEGRSSSGSSDRDPSEETTGRHTAGTGAPTRIWAAALSAGRWARRRREAD
ncbi:MAG: hypothetical protein H0T66_18320, partial [Geodermatophilaceae bacterium]|nr:hypothetical protein [Geodermatophilaceae bacterium]